MKKYIIIINILFFIGITAFASDKKLGIEEKLGEKLPLDLLVTDESGNKLPLSSFIDKPTILTFVYYECPGICTPLMSEIAVVINRTDLVPGTDYNVISLSFDHTENYELAARKKVNYLKIIDKYFPKEAWRFLTADSAEVYKLTDAAGFYFQREGDEYIHSGTLIFVSKDGVITRYLYPGYSERKKDFSILPFDFKMAVLETSKGNITPTIAKLVKYCFTYDAEGKTYVFNFTRVAGAGMVLLAGIFVLYLTIKPKKKN